MGGSYSRRVVGEPVEFGAVNGGEPFLAVLSRIDVYRPVGGAPAVHFLVDVDYETYVRMDEAGAFGFSLFSVDPAAGTASFTDEIDLEITLRAADELIPEGAGAMNDMALMEAMLSGATDEPGRFLDPSQWFWLSVMQRLAPKSGALQGIRSKHPPK